MTKEVTPYELRLKMIELAKEMLDQQFAQARDIAMTTFTAAIEIEKNHGNVLKNIPLNFPTPPTLEEVLKVAEGMNQFVSGLMRPKK